jgi:hypothetical protein
MANSNKGAMMKFVQNTLAITAGILLANMIQRQMLNRGETTSM